jgi:hypothetical protein
MKTLPILAAIFAMIAGTSHALLIPFDLRDTGATAEIESGTIVRNGVTATLSPLVVGESGSLNQTTSAFGINGIESGDDTDTLDARGDDAGSPGAESISITFDTDILFTQLGLSLFSEGETGSLTINGFASLPLADTGVGSDVYNFASDNLVLTGQTVLLSWGSGNGFSFDNFKIDTDVPQASVPESGTTLAFLGLGVFGLVLFRRLRC